MAPMTSRGQEGVASDTRKLDCRLINKTLVLWLQKAKQALN